jgi:hypothetical protein
VAVPSAPSARKSCRACRICTATVVLGTDSKHPEGTAMQAYLKAMAIMAGLLGTLVALLPLVT